MSLTQPMFPAKSPVAVTTISQFPDNPKSLILKQCKTTRDLNQVHAHLIKTRGGHRRICPSVVENLLESVAILLPQDTTNMDYAFSIFRGINRPDSSAYNVMIRGFTLKNSPGKSLLLFKEMKDNFVLPDDFTFPCTLKACSRLQALEEGKQIHAQISKSGFGLHGFMGNTLIHMYGNCGDSQSARRVFDKMTDRDIFAWNSLFSGYCKTEKWQEVIKLFHEMRELGFLGFEEVSLICVLTACGRMADIELGEWIADYVEKRGLKKNVSLVTSLVDMYAKCGKLESARKLFDQLGKRDVVTWTAMISGYTQARRCKEALEIFREMQFSNVDPNEVTMVSLLSSCAVLGAFETGKWIHLFIKKKKMKLTVTLGTALIDFYMKCGSIENGIGVFDQMPLKNVFSLTVLIQGLGNNGQGRRALEYFRWMLEKNIEPNDVTFIGVLSACCHTGLVKEGRKFFSSMSRDFGIEPKMEHYGCMVDILGRAGLIQEAYEFIQNMPMQPASVIWRTLLASCRAHRNIEIGEESVKHLVEIESMHSGDYILLSSIYASVGMLDDAQRVRSQMREKRLKKPPGCSLIELDGEIHEFFAEDNTNPNSHEIYHATESIIKRIKSFGYVPNTADARLDAEEDDKEAAVSHHSEKLAIAFGIIRTSPGTTIRISKNLRVCTDCHSATKIISKVYGREIVVRDRNRFHSFKDGVCSCNDYW